MYAIIFSQSNTTEQNVNYAHSIEPQIKYVYRINWMRVILFMSGMFINFSEMHMGLGVKVRELYCRYKRNLHVSC